MLGLFGPKPDGVIESARYTPDRGRLTVVRCYRRRGAIWGDLELLTREDLLKAMKAGRRFYVGRRQINIPGSFELGPAVELREVGGGTAIRTAGTSGERDYLENAPVF